MKVLICGDVHGAWTTLAAVIKEAREVYGISHVFQAGDFGYFPSVYKKHGHIHFSEHVVTCDGNHEDHQFMQANSSMFFVNNLEPKNRGSIYQLGERRFGFIGGALHVDRPQMNNAITESDLDRAVELFNIEQPQVIISHDCPGNIGVGVQGDPRYQPGVNRYIYGADYIAGHFTDCGDMMLTALWGRLEYRPKYWFFGHYHIYHDKEVDGTQFTCVGQIHPPMARRLTFILDTETLELRVE